MPYITPAGAEAVKSYKYNGEDRSLLYKHVLSPLAEACVQKFTPVWVAPNLITFLGVLVQLSALLWLATTESTFQWNFSADAAAEAAVQAAGFWPRMWAAAAILIYQTLDNMDGKQARRVGASSPLGLLFDHGCDAMNAGLMGSLIVAMCLGADVRSWQLYMTWAVTTVVFFFNTWEEYHLGRFILPLFNGPSEGLIMSAAMMATSAFTGPLWWGKPITSELNPLLLLALKPAFLVVGCLRFLFSDANTGAATPLEVVIATLFMMALTTVIVNTVNVIKHVSAEAVAARATDKIFGKVMAALGRVAPLAALNVAVLAWLCDAEARPVVDAHPWLFLLAAGCSFADMTSKLMVSHACDMKFKPFYGGIAVLGVMPAAKALAACGLSFPLDAIGSIMGPQTPLFLLIVAFVVSATGMLSFFFYAVNALATILNIDVFDTTKQRARSGHLKN